MPHAPLGPSPRVDALDVLARPVVSDAYSRPLWLPEAPEKLEEFRQFLNEGGFEFLEYPGGGGPGGFYVRGVQAGYHNKENPIRDAVAAKARELRSGGAKPR